MAKIRSEAASQEKEWEEKDVVGREKSLYEAQERTRVSLENLENM